MNFNNDITLRPRFSFEVDQDAKIVLSHFKSHAKTKNNIRVSIVEPHVFLKITKQEQHFWSPQLHLEILDQKSSTTVKGLFGPSPVVWTLFMFLHFLIAGLFIGGGIWVYVNHALDKSIILPIIMMFTMVIIWIIFYFGGQIGKQKGKHQMNILHQFMQGVIVERSSKRKTT